MVWLSGAWEKAELEPVADAVLEPESVPEAEAEDELESVLEAPALPESEDEPVAVDDEDESVPVAVAEEEDESVPEAVEEDESVDGLVAEESVAEAVLEPESVLEALSVLVLDAPELELELWSPDEPEPTPFGLFATLLLPPIVSVHVFSTRTAGCPWSSVTSVSLTVHVCVTATPEGLRGRSGPLHPAAVTTGDARIRHRGRVQRHRQREGLPAHDRDLAGDAGHGHRTHARSEQERQVNEMELHGGVLVLGSVVFARGGRGVVERRPARRCRRRCVGEKKGGG
jgi:hypothetical protein